MVKRKGHFMEKLCTIDNINLADDLVRRSIKKRMYKAISLYYKDKITYEQLERRFASYSGWLKYCNSKHLLHIIYLKTGLNYSNFVGKKDKISNYRGGQCT